MKLRSRWLGALLLMAGCTQPSGNTQAVVDNAINADLNITDAANDRADHLDERSDQLLRQASMANRQAAAALRNEAQSDLSAAAQIRQQGLNQGAQVEDADEQQAGLMNAR